MTNKATNILGISAMVLLLQGCIMVSEGPKNYPPREELRSPTLGEQLQSLHEARRSGAIDEDEYLRLRERLIDGAN